MRRSREDAAQTRRDIVETASRLFRERGIAGVSVADVMGVLGMTVGGFYRHFESKEALVSEAIAAASKATVRDGVTAQELVDGYVSSLHAAHPGSGCPVAALCSEAAREGADVRRAFTEAVQSMVASLSNVRVGRKKQLLSVAAAVGAVVLARAVDDPSLSKEILAAVRSELR